MGLFCTSQFLHAEHAISAHVISDMSLFCLRPFQMNENVICDGKIVMVRTNFLSQRSKISLLQH